VSGLWPTSVVHAMLISLKRKVTYVGTSLFRCWEIVDRLFLFCTPLSPSTACVFVFKLYSWRENRREADHICVGAVFAATWRDSYAFQVLQQKNSPKGILGNEHGFSWVQHKISGVHFSICRINFNKLAVKQLLDGSSQQVIAFFWCCPAILFKVVPVKYGRQFLLNVVL